MDQNYVRAETHAAANAILIEQQGKVPIVAAWGGGLPASVDGLRFVEVATTDQASDSDMVFGIFSMLGYRFAPRFADLGDQRFWRADLPDGSTGAYGVLEAIARNKLNPKKVITQWPATATPERSGSPTGKGRKIS